jgi:glyoxylase-like metal-dependent hydrolase (beta-lactamase superfamily II)
MIQKISSEIMAIHMQNFGSIVYLLNIQQPTTNTKHLILIDTSSKENSKQLIEELKKINIKPKDINIIILTHAHYDHTGNINLFQKAKIYGNFTKIINADHSQSKEAKILPISNLKLPTPDFKIISTPGHTQNDIVILYKKILFSGDTIFNNGYIGRNDLPESNPQEQKKSLKKISKLKYNTLCPGH